MSGQRGQPRCLQQCPLPPPHSAPGLGTPEGCKGQGQGHSPELVRLSWLSAEVGEYAWGAESGPMPVPVLGISLHQFHPQLCEKEVTVIIHLWMGWLRLQEAQGLAQSLTISGKARSDCSAHAVPGQWKWGMYGVEEGWGEGKASVTAGESTLALHVTKSATDSLWPLQSPTLSGPWSDH